jgi:hypothetical protein
MAVHQCDTKYACCKTTVGIFCKWLMGRALCVCDLFSIFAMINDIQ